MNMKWIQTTKDTQDRLTEKERLSFSKLDSEGTPKLTIMPEESYQTVMGFGGAFTEAAAYTLSNVSEEQRMGIIESYFHPERGLGYSLGRTHIHSCDFSLENYTYVEENDTDLSTFSIEREHRFVIPFIKDAVKTRGEDLTILSSPWSPPAWMKTNNEMNNGGKLLPEYRSTWASYYSKYIKAMEEAGIPIWGVTVQNEPEATQVWDSCRYSAEEERDFVRDYLGPTLEKEGLGDKKIVIWDHNRDIAYERAETVLSDPEAAKYIWGTGLHWYVSEEFENLSRIHDAFPDKHLIFTEGCIEGGVQLGAWHTGERYARNIMGDLNNWLEGWIDWNLVLNEQGGPNHVGNYCDAPIIVDTNTKEVHYNSSYYYIGHFSKYIKPNAVRIKHKIEHDSLQVVTFQNEDESIVAVVMNDTDEAIEVYVTLNGQGCGVTFAAHSISTLIL
ncbi:glycoside hydrolase family 30 beta sandwich domain-containing protein [Pontibacillus sp. HMF3514]|uniref:glycoside hydrolase family 30 protein n=1 Tax=Pontibacillus sp. HMF3514 TaxID=2692425 RepID=UPI00131F6412|nr:glycoside hydrolase family 30 protein [Pontibacillus sp. HMF3514]QHE53652.1 glucosylceramidase [Pontibacillus sp. HMF3514]